MANENEIQATGTFVTRKGLSLITKLAAAQGELNFTRAAVGTGKPPEGYAPDALINLNAYRMDAEISEYGIRDDKAYITMQVSCEEVQEGFLLTEVGVFAQDPDEGEILYGYMDVSTDPTYIYANGSSNRLKFAEFTLYVLIGSVDRVTAAVTPGSIITRETLTAENLRTIDTGGIVGEAGADITGQSWMDAITNKIANELITNEKLIERLGNYILRSQIVNNLLATQVGNVLDATQGKALMDRITQLNSDLAEKNPKIAMQEYTNNFVLSVTTWTDAFKLWLNPGLYIIKQSAFPQAGIDGISLSMRIEGVIDEQQTDRANTPGVRGVIGTNIYYISNGGTYSGGIYINNSTAVLVNNNLKIMKVG